MARFAYVALLAVALRSVFNAHASAILAFHFLQSPNFKHYPFLHLCKIGCTGILSEFDRPVPGIGFRIQLVLSLIFESFQKPVDRIGAPVIFSNRI